MSTPNTGGYKGMLTLYLGNKNYSSWSLRAWLPMKKAGIDFNEIVIPLRTPETKSRITALSEGGQVPFLSAPNGIYRNQSTIIYDSLAIAEWAAEVSPALWPAHPMERAAARSAAALMHSGFADLRRACPMNIRLTAPSPPDDQAALEDAARIDGLWTRWLDASGGPFLFGEWSIADAFYAPIVTRFESWKLPRSATAQSYIRTVLNDPQMLVWRDSSVREPFVIEDIDAMMRSE